MNCFIHPLNVFSVDPNCKKNWILLFYFILIFITFYYISYNARAYPLLQYFSLLLFLVFYLECLQLCMLLSNILFKSRTCFRVKWLINRSINQKETEERKIDAIMFRETYTTISYFNLLIHRFGHIKNSLRLIKRGS